MMKFENCAEVGDVIKAFDFKPIPGRTDSYMIGKVIKKGDVVHPKFDCVMFSGYHIEITGSSYESEYRLGDIGYVPFEMDFGDYDGRIQLV